MGEVLPRVVRAVCEGAFEVSGGGRQGGGIEWMKADWVDRGLFFFGRRWAVRAIATGNPDLNVVCNQGENENREWSSPHRRLKLIPRRCLMGFLVYDNRLCSGSTCEFKGRSSRGSG